jgi:hypothetical protein
MLSAETRPATREMASRNAEALIVTDCGYVFHHACTRRL